MTIKMNEQEKEAFEILAPVVGEELAYGVVEMRQCTVRKKITGGAAKLLIKEYLKTNNPRAAAEMQILRAWQGFSSNWYFNEIAKDQRHGARRTIADAARAYDAQFGDRDASFGVPSIGRH